MEKSRYYNKPHRIKKKKSILKNRFFWPGILFILILFSIFYFLFFSNIFQVKKITVTGAEKVSAGEIKLLVLPQNIFFINTRKIEKDILDKFSQIAKVQARRSFPDALKISVTERIAAAVWCETENTCFFMDKDGVIFGEVSTNTYLISVYGLKEILGKEMVGKILEITGKLNDNLGITTTKAIIVSEERLNIQNSEGWEIYFNSKGDLDWQLRELGLVLEKQIAPVKRSGLEYIDLRFSRVYYK